MKTSIQVLASTLAIALSLIPPTPVAQGQGAPDGRVRGGATYIQFDPPQAPQDAPGGRARGGASRTGNCPAVAQPLTALVPAVDDKVWGLTTEAHPSFWFYVPYALNADHPAEFVLLDQQNNYIYRTPIMDENATATGIVQIMLPDGITLAENQVYQWVFMVNCDQSTVFTRGGIQRIQPGETLAAQLDQLSANADPLDLARVYASNGIWFDALTRVAEQRRANPQDEAIAAEWQSLLRSAGLTDVADRPFVSPLTKQP